MTIDYRPYEPVVYEGEAAPSENEQSPGWTSIREPDSDWSLADIHAVYGWLPPEALDLFIEAWPESGNADVAWAAVRQDSRYEQWFPGNMTEDGRPRYSEDTYAAVTASYDDIFRSVGIDGPALDYMRERYGELISGDVAPSELETNRVAPMHDRIVTQSDAIRREYAERYGVDLTTDALIASAMNPDLGDKILLGQIQWAEIAGEAREEGISINDEMIDLLARSNKVDRAEADRLFQDWSEFSPVLNVLARRHQDPDDEFNLEEFVQADIFQNPAQRRRMRRMVAQEQSLFTNRGALARDRTTGALTGLEAL